MSGRVRVGLALPARGSQHGLVLGQDEARSDLYAVDKGAYVEANADRQFPLSEAAVALARHVRSRWARVSRV